VLWLQAIDRDHELQVGQRGPRQWHGTECAGYDLDVGALDQLRQQDLKLAVTDKWVTSYNRQMERFLSSHHVEHTSDQVLSFEIGQAAQVCRSKMSVFIRVTPRTP